MFKIQNEGRVAFLQGPRWCEGVFRWGKTALFDTDEHLHFPWYCARPTKAMRKIDHGIDGLEFLT